VVGQRRDGVSISLSRTHMKERGIMMSAPMVRAILRPVSPKTKTRRLSNMWGKVKAGDRLCVRETFWECAGDLFYRATHDENDPPWEYIEYQGSPKKWRPALHMPRLCSRILLECTADARPERLQDISNEDAKAEGIFQTDGGWTWDMKAERYRNAPNAFRALWFSINGADSWIANPALWVLAFKRVKP